MKFTTRYALLATSILSINMGMGIENFDSLPAGSLSKANTVYGSLEAEQDNLAIHNKGKSGTQSLRLLGGEKKQVTLTLKESPKIDVGLQAWAERWTGQDPFEFKIIAVTPSGEKEIYDGQKAVRSGGFHTKINATIPAKTTKLIFQSTTPEKTGVLIDDLYIVPVIPMKFLNAEVKSDVWPTIIRKPQNPLLRFDIETEGGLKPLTFTGTTLDMTGTNLAQIESISFIKGGEFLDNGDIVVEEETKAKIIGNNPKAVKLEGSLPLESGSNKIWISVKLKDNAKAKGFIKAKPLGIFLNNKATPIAEKKMVAQRIGYGIGMRDTEVLPTKRVTKCYRIPAMVLSKAGTLIAAADIRYNHNGDLPADIDMGVSRSTDGGETWTPMTIALAFKDALPGFKGAGNGDAALLVDNKSGRIWMAVLWSHGGHPIWSGKQGTNAPDQTSQLVLTYSDDDGKTWSKAINITDQIKKPEWGVNFQGPGSGICMKDGTLVFPCQFWYDYDGTDGVKGRKAHCSIIYSKDQGKTWNVGTSPVRDTSEAQVVELADGSIMINSRNEAGGHWRAIYTTKDFGATWQEHPTNNNGNGNGLIEPGACQGSILYVPNKGGVKHPLFFSNPSFGGSRKNMTIKASLDQGMSWPEKFHVLYDERNGGGYSSLAPINDKYIGVLYEGRFNVYFLRIPYSEIFKQKSTTEQ